MGITVQGGPVKKEETDRSDVIFVYEPGKAELMVWEEDGQYQLEISGPHNDGSGSVKTYKIGNPTKNHDGVYQKYEMAKKQLESGARVVILDGWSARVEPLEERVK